MEINFWKKMAESFLRDAKFAISERRWNSSAFHLVTEEEYKKWYKNFIKKEMIKV